MNYLKSLCVCFFFLLLILLSWHFSTVHNVNPRDLRDAYVPLFTGMGIAVGGFLLTKVKIGWISLPGQGMVLGALIGILPCIMYYIGEFFDTITSGFLLGVLAWIFFVIFIAATALLAVSAVKNAILSVIRLDFYPVIVYFILFFSAITSMMILFTAAKEISGFLAFASLLGLLGGIGGWMVKLPDGTGEVRDANGNIHYVVATLSSDRVITTSGDTMRRRAEGSDIFDFMH